MKMLTFLVSVLILLFRMFRYCDNAEVSYLQTTFPYLFFAQGAINVSVFFYVTYQGTADEKQL